MPRLDYSNGLLYGLPKCTVAGLQAVQTSAARIVTQERLRDHDLMSRVLIGLHSLPVDKMIEYKLLLYTYKAWHDLAPGYLCELVVSYVPRRLLRSAELNVPTVPPGKPGKYVSRSFARPSANLLKSLRAARLTNSPVSILGTVFKLSSATFSFKVYHYFSCIIVCYTCNILFGMFTVLDYSSALESSIIRPYTNIVYYYY